MVKETREGESRVSLVPRDIKKLIEQGHHVFFEHRAGEGAQFFDQDYQNAGAVIRYISDETILSYQEYFKDIDLIVRAKRPERSREILESKTISKETIMIGALDPLEKQSPHIQEYHEANIIAYSIDQLHLPPDDPMNLLAVMSKIAGKLALLNAIKHFDSIIKSKNLSTIDGLQFVLERIDKANYNTTDAQNNLLKEGWGQIDQKTATKELKTLVGKIIRN